MCTSQKRVLHKILTKNKSIFLSPYSHTQRRKNEWLWEHLYLDGCILFNVPIKPSTLTPYEIIKYQTLYGIQAGNNILAYTHFGFLRICNFRSGIYIYTPIENYPNRCTCLIFNILVMYLTG